MNEKDVAERIRFAMEHNIALDSLKRALNHLLDELDPPRPEPGTVVWWRPVMDKKWHLGISGNCGIVPVTHLDLCWDWDPEEIEWKPARIPGPDEVAVKQSTMKEIETDLRLFKEGLIVIAEKLNPSPRVMEVVQRVLQGMEAER